MTTAERDAYVIAKLAAFRSQGLTSAQAVNEVVRTCGFTNVALVGHDQSSLVTDIALLQTAANNLTVAAVRTATITGTVVNRQSLHPAPNGVPTADVFHMRALNAGA